jgi:hypothetical protein
MLTNRSLLSEEPEQGGLADILQTKQPILKPVYGTIKCREPEQKCFSGKLVLIQDGEW